ncbi:phycobilisome rod-core linker polypeptide [Nostoc sphaeroides CHAB 2801]|uniref:phycobilisome rod-core linker polypeptide n=1 Tax=Nostoc sphaeroides TaxID=446679 RepID=UPI001E5B2104|nr:phycobilisome rod-core linker polypeptide [Nostoc sphaeroides]MCC5633151.1 phycobilisome rod-core linker polypeptide [Nostoc sphaeroides CHAB 2801]
MAIPLLKYSPSSRNHRVSGYEILGDEQPRIYTGEYLQSSLEMDALIMAAYRQIFHEQQMLDSNRQTCLESQLRTGQITVRDFIRGLAISDTFRRLNYESNNNYRFVQICSQRFLGREVYNEREKLAWSIVLASKGLFRFIDALLDSEEYISNFGYNTVPYQRRRILQGRSIGELPFTRMARYGEDYRDKLLLTRTTKQVEPFNLQTFLRSSNRDVVLLLLASTLALIVLFTLLTTFGYFPKFGGY